MNDPALIVLDWRATNARAALLAADGTVLGEQCANSDVGELGAIGFALRFDELTGDWPSLPAIACGMIGSKQGWCEVEYLDCPLSADEIAANLTMMKHSDRTIAVVPGLKLDDGWRMDVMRGEETRLAGFLVQHPGFTGTIIMPAAHSKCVWVADGRISTFQTYMTGDLFSAIAGHTILRHAVSGANDATAGFAYAVETVAEEDRPLDGRLFGLRARALLGDADAASLRQELSALLIQSELRAAIDDGFALDDRTVLIGAPELTARYAKMLSAQQIIVRQIDGDDLVWPALFDLAIWAGIVDRPS